MTSKKILEARREAAKKIAPLTAESFRAAISRNPRANFHENYQRSDGTCFNWRTNGALKTWKTRPDDFRLPIKYGLREYAAIQPYNVDQFHLASDCPVNKVDYADEN